MLEIVRKLPVIRLCFFWQSISKHDVGKKDVGVFVFGRRFFFSFEKKKKELRRFVDREIDYPQESAGYVNMSGALATPHQFRQVMNEMSLGSCVCKVDVPYTNICFP